MRLEVEKDIPSIADYGVWIASEALPVEYGEPMPKMIPVPSKHDTMPLQYLLIIFKQWLFHLKWSKLQLLEHMQYNK